MSNLDTPARLRQSLEYAQAVNGTSLYVSPGMAGELLAMIGRHDEELLAYEITVDNLRREAEAHGEALAAYELTVANLRAELAKPEPKPMTDAEIAKLRHLIDWTANWSSITFARAVEAAHGIKETP